MGLSLAVAKIFDLTFLVLFIAILLSWIPNIDWQKEPFRSLRAFSNIFFNPFRRIIPPIGMIDITPIIAFLCLSVLRNILVGFLYSLGL